MKITLARALKYKNRLVGKISAVTEIIRSKNSVIKGTEREVDINELVTLRTKLIDNLVDLKTEINRANEAIVRDIFLISELKSEITFLKSIDTTQGMASQDRAYYPRSEPVEFEAHIRFNDVEELKTSTNKKIDAAQDRIDRHNHLIDIDFAILDEVY